MLIGLAIRFLKIGFLPTVAVVSILFGLGHLYQGYDFASTIGLHVLMNLSWNVFDIEASNALGGWAANIFRIATIILLVVFTIRKIKQDGSALKGQLL